MKNYSLWLDEPIIKCNSIKDNMEVDVLIIGGGITGLSTLYQLRKSSLKTILVERNTCGLGVTCRSTAKITYLQEKQFLNIQKFVDRETAKMYFESQKTAVNLLCDIINNEKIDCNLLNSPSYLFTNDKNNLSKLNSQKEFLKECNVDFEEISDVPFVKNCIKAIKVSDSYTFHPVKYINFLKNKFKNIVFEDSKVTSIKKENNCYFCKVNGYEIAAKYVVVASHYPYFLIPFMTPLKTTIETSYIGVKRIEENISCNAINIDSPSISLRTYSNGKNNYLVYLYQSFLSSNIKYIKDNFDILNKEYHFQYLWSNKDIITSDFMPYIGRLYKNDDSFLIGTGYNTWGMTNGTLAGMIIADIILKKDNPYISLFEPRRSFNFSNIIHFPINIGASMKSLLKSTKSNVNNTKVIYKKINGTAVAIYVDENNQEHIVLNKCPHMKCGLVFNEVEKTWDCHCHGSRFNIDGKCIEGPSNLDITFKF